VTIVGAIEVLFHPSLGPHGATTRQACSLQVGVLMLIYPLSKEERVEIMPGPFADSHRRNFWPTKALTSCQVTRQTLAMNETLFTVPNQRAAVCDVCPYHQQNWWIPATEAFVHIISRTRIASELATEACLSRLSYLGNQHCAPSELQSPGGRACGSHSRAVPAHTWTGWLLSKILNQFLTA
jgi:hypothetical protein